MKYSMKVSHAVHIMVFIQTAQGLPVTSDKIAESIHTNPGCVRQIMSKLRKAGLLKSVTGHPLPELARDPSAISLLDIYKAVENEKPWTPTPIRNAESVLISSLLCRSSMIKFKKTQKIPWQESVWQILLDDFTNGYKNKPLCFT